MKGRATEHKGVRSLIEIAKKTRHEYAPVALGDLPHLDSHFYQTAQVELEQLGFTALGDWENLTLRPACKGLLSFDRTCLRIAVSSDGLVMAAVYHARPSFLVKLVLRLLRGIKEDFKIREFETEYSNGTFLSTNDAVMMGHSSPPFILCESCPQKAPIVALYRQHLRRMAAYQSLDKSLRPLTCHTVAEVLAAQDRQQALRADYRNQRHILGEEECLRLKQLNVALTDRIRTLAQKDRQTEI